MVKSAFLSGSADSVFIHSVGSLNSSYLDILLEDPTLEVRISGRCVTVQCHAFIVYFIDFLPMKDKLFISDINLSYDDELDKITSQQATSIGLMGIASFGGFFVQVKIFNSIKI